MENLDKLVEASNGEFTKEQVENFINISNNIANKAVLSYLCKLLYTNVPVESRNKTKSVADKIKKLTYTKNTGYMQCDVLPNLKLNLGLALCKSDYMLDMNAPDNEEFLEDFAGKVRKLIDIAIAFWRQFCESNPAIIDEVKKLKPNVNFDLLAYDHMAKTMMFCTEVDGKLIPATCGYRIAIFPCWVNEKGQPFIKK